MTATSSTASAGDQTKDSGAAQAQKALADSYLSYIQASLAGSQTVASALAEQARSATSAALEQVSQLSSTLAGATAEYAKQAQELTLSTLKAIAEVTGDAGSFAGPALASFAPLAEVVSSSVQTGKELIAAGVAASKEILSAQRQVAEQLVGTVSYWWD